MIREVVDKKIKILGSNHPDTLTTLGNLATVLFQQRKLKTAENLLKEILPIRLKTLRDDHPSTLNNMNDLAMALDFQRKHIPAIKLYRRALAGRQKSLGTHHPDTLSTKSNLASALTVLGQHAEAETLLREVVHNATDSFDTVAYNKAASLWNLADLLDRQKRFEDACHFYERACAELAKIESDELSVCEAWYADMRRQMARRSRGGVWRFEISHVLFSSGQRILRPMASGLRYHRH